MENIRTVLADMPCSVKAYTICQDDYYTIVLNSNLTHEQNMISYWHELRHIQNSDFIKSCPVNMIEFYSHMED